VNEEDLPWKYREHAPLTPIERWAYRGMIVGIVLFWAAVIAFVRWLHG
jgi:hypothetical protein